MITLRPIIQFHKKNPKLHLNLLSKNLWNKFKRKHKAIEYQN